MAKMPRVSVRWLKVLVLGSFALVFTEFGTHAASVYSQRTSKGAFRKCGLFQMRNYRDLQKYCFHVDHLVVQATKILYRRRRGIEGYFPNPLGSKTIRRVS